MYDKINQKSNELIEFMIEEKSKMKNIDITSLHYNKTVLIIVDMVKGFSDYGLLSSPRVKKLVPSIVSLQRKCKESSIYTIAFVDNHTEQSIELKFRPKHCIKGTREDELVNEIKEVGIDKIISKNSTNGFVAKEFLNWLEENEDRYDNFIVVGVCTDICISQFVLTLKAYFNENNMDKRVIVPIDYVDTYDFGIHSGDIMNLISIYQMLDNGIEVIKDL
ncbi:isochorismatase family cysteine hydrolase [Abyssisolibacter fermentans]|uniref:isochorismatase family cysteine hydrolase n=1 Tax=Abyssisolibacter fermentans TaxID=1766203 RepID=UPI00082BF156|nr:isochorismatase family cysteine hydrolase [Abyssisolibacter fermentans]